MSGYYRTIEVLRLRVTLKGLMICKMVLVHLELLEYFF
jgi:hypothetical protein